MRFAFRSLRARLMFAFLAVTVAAVGTVTIVVFQSAEREVARYERLINQLEMTRMSHWLIGYYTARDTWDGIQPFVDEMAVMLGARIVLTDRTGRIVADTAQDPSEPRFSRTWPSRSLTHYPEMDPVGTLHVSAETTIQATFRRRLEASIEYFVWVAGALAVGVAILVSTAMTRPITAPIRELARCARLAGAGDLTVRVEMSHESGELHELASAFNTMATELETAATRRSHLVENTAHEFRTPLTNIRGYVEGIRDKVVPSDVAVPILLEEVTLMSRLVDDLQDLALADAGALRFVIEEHDIASVIRHAVRAAEPAATAKGVRLAAVGAEQPVPCLLDANRIAQVLHNLITNAITSCRADDTVTVGLQADSTDIEITVCDTGAGISTEKQPFVFDRLYRGDPSRSRTTGGSGLGLPIAKHIVEGHDGTIHLESDEGQGTRFIVRLPRR